MALNDIFPIAGKSSEWQMTQGERPTVAQDINIAGETIDVEDESPLAEIADVQVKPPQEASFGDLINKATSKRALPAKDEPFGKSYATEDEPLLSPTLGPQRAALMQKAAAGQPVRFDMMAGNYFKQLPIVTGRYSTEIPIAAMFAEELEKPGPAAKELAAFNKRVDKVKFFPSVAGLGEAIFKSDVTPIVDEAFARYGNRASLILNGGGRTKEERELGNRFNSTLSSVENLANLTNLTGKVVQKLQRDHAAGKWVDPETDKFTRDYLEGLEVMVGAPKEELYDYINKGTARLKSLLAFGRGLDDELTGNPTLSHLVEAQLGTAAAALKGTGARIFDTQQLIDVIDAKNIPTDQIDSLVDTMYEKGYRFGGTEKEDRKKIRSKIMNYFIPSMRTTFLNTPYEKGVGTTKEYVANPKEDVYTIQDRKTGHQLTYSSPATWKLSEPLTEGISLQRYFNPSTNQYESASGAQKQTIQTIRVVPTYKTGPLKGQPINDVILPTLKPEDIVNRIVAEGTVRRVRKTKELKTDQWGNTVSVTGEDQYVDEPAFFDYSEIEQLIKQRKITLTGIDKDWGGIKSVTYTGPKAKKPGTATGKAAEVIRGAATETGNTKSNPPPTSTKKPSPY